MESKKIDKYLETLKEIKDLDNKAEMLSKIAETAANNNINCLLDINLRDLDRKDDVVVSEEEDYTKQYMNNLQTYLSNIFGNNGTAKISDSIKPKIHYSYQHNLSNKTVLRLVSVLLEDIKDRRNELVESLKVIK